MRLILLTTLAMLAFAANSILTRAALLGGHMDSASFSVVRLFAGALMLSVILLVRGGGFPLFERARIVGVLGLSAYMIGFSWAYMTLDAGLGALIQFGSVQMGMFVWSALRDVAPTPRQMLGAAIAFVGLMIALWPENSGVTQPAGPLFMIFAGLGWAAYSLVGRKTTAPLNATAANFILATPVVALTLIGQDLHYDFTGIALACVAGAITSGVGYAVWYSVLPLMAASKAAVVQLSVPVIAIVAGAVFLGETATLTIGVAALLVLGGITLAVTSNARS